MGDKKTEENSDSKENPFSFSNFVLKQDVEDKPKIEDKGLKYFIYMLYDFYMKFKFDVADINPSKFSNIMLLCQISKVEM